MSKFFYRGTPDVMGKYGKAGYTPKAKMKLGTANNPLTLVVATSKRQQAVQAIVGDHNLVANIEVNSEAAENLLELDGVLNTPKTQMFAKTAERNDPCSCGSGKKYKKCCG
ncbi:zinc chelation protein SecC [Thalassotalea sp. 42_200_T64]|nr:zinc chelation protein SecC [Thalassotalea sp. 42_200_T64]